MNLHTLWGKAQDYPDYIKREWIELQLYIERLEEARNRLLASSKEMLQRVDEYLANGGKLTLKEQATVNKLISDITYAECI